MVSGYRKLEAWSLPSMWKVANELRDRQVLILLDILLVLLPACAVIDDVKPHVTCLKCQGSPICTGFGRYVEAIASSRSFRYVHLELVPAHGLGFHEHFGRKGRLHILKDSGALFLALLKRCRTTGA